MSLSNRERLVRLGEWVKTTCCDSMMLKAPVESADGDAVKLIRPRCFVGNFYPAFTAGDPYKVSPSILVMFAGGNGCGETMKYMDNRNSIKRPREIAQTLEVQLIHAVFEPIQMRVKTGVTETPWDECIDEGSMVLQDWMEQTMAHLIGADTIPGTDLFVQPESVRWEPLKEDGAVADRRPAYLGVVTVTFETETRQDDNEAIRALLE